MGSQWNGIALFVVTLYCTQIQGALVGTILTGDVQLVFSRVLLTIKEEGAAPTSVKTVELPYTTQIVTQDAKSANLTLNFGHTNSSDGKLVVNPSHVQISFLNGGYWTTSSLVASLEGKFDATSFSFTGKFLSPMQIAAPKGMSFHCSKFGPLYPARNGTEKPPTDKTIPTFLYSIEIFNFQIQPFMAKDSEMFGSSYDCVGFFSIGILSGIFINIILIVILVWGLAMIMNVRTMDRFDDPKGKPISVGATD